MTNFVYNLIAILLMSAHAEPRRFIVDHDGASDDYAALALVLAATDVRVVGVTFEPADSYREPAIDTTLGLLNLFKRRDVPVAAGSGAGVNPFPAAWREASVTVANIPDLKTPRSERSARGFTSLAAPRHLVQMLKRAPALEILATGPLTNLAAALKENSDIRRRITRVTFMGGALDVPGNVSQDGRRPVAEWNIFNDPPAVNAVLRAGVAVRFVPLDVTNQAPVTHAFLDRLAKQEAFTLSRVFLGIWATVSDQIEHPDPQRRYYFWDTLAAAIAVQPSLATFRRERVSVVERGPEEGRLVRDEKGWWAEIAVAARATALDDLVLRSLRH